VNWQFQVALARVLYPHKCRYLFTFFEKQACLWDRLDNAISWLSILGKNYEMHWSFILYISFTWLYFFRNLKYFIITHSSYSPWLSILLATYPIASLMSIPGYLNRSCKMRIITCLFILCPLFESSTWKKYRRAVLWLSPSFISIKRLYNYSRSDPHMPSSLYAIK